MATARFTSYGALVEFSDIEINRITALISGGSQVITIASALSGMLTAPALLVAIVIVSLIGIGASLLGACNAGNGVQIKIFWKGKIWCYPNP